MKLLIHDLEVEQFNNLFPKLSDDVTVISDNKTIHSCVGCFDCWVKTPGTCIIKDDYQNMGELFSRCNELVIISRCYYGGYSPFVKNVLDRSISYILPYFTIRNKEMHHKSRYLKPIKISSIVYSKDITEKEMNTMESLVAANAINFNQKDYKVIFCESPENTAELWRNMQ